MKATLNQNGIVFVKDIKNPPDYLIKSSKSDWYWTTWRWLDNRIELGNSGKELLKSFRKKESQIKKIINQKLIYPTDIWDKAFNFKLWDGQKEAASALVSAKKFCLADSVGLGKTFSSFAACFLLFEKQLIKSLLIICTASTKFQWKLELQNLLKDEYRKKYPIIVIDGAKTKKIDLLRFDCPIKIISYETARDNVKSIVTPDAIIADEAWKFRNHRSKTFKCLKPLFEQVPYRFALNPAPIGNGYEELFGLFAVTDSAVFPNWKFFENKYIQYDLVRYPVRKNGKFIKMSRQFREISGYRNIPDLQMRLHSVLLRRTAEDFSQDLPELTCSTYWISLSQSQYAEYSKIRNNRAIEPLARVVLAKKACLFTSNTLPGESPKFHELVDILQHRIPHDKVLVFCESKTYLKAILPVLEKMKIRTGIICGDTLPKDRDRIRTDFAEGLRYRVLLLTAAGEAGLNLQAANYVINLDLPWNSERLKQRIGRVRPYLGGSERHVHVMNIMAYGTIEEKVVKIVQKKLGLFAKLFQEDCSELISSLSVKHLADLV